MGKFSFSLFHLLCFGFPLVANLSRYVNWNRCKNITAILLEQAASVNITLFACTTSQWVPQCVSVCVRVCVNSRLSMHYREVSYGFYGSSRDLFTKLDLATEVVSFIIYMDEYRCYISEQITINIFTNMKRVLRIFHSVSKLFENILIIFLNF